MPPIPRGSSRCLRKKYSDRKTLADIAAEREIGVPRRIVQVAGAVEIIEKYAADSSGFVTMFEKEIFVTPGPIFLVGRHTGMTLAHVAHRLVKGLRIGLLLVSAPPEHRRQI